MPSLEFNDFNTLLDHYAKKRASKTALVYTDAHDQEQQVTYKQLQDLTTYNSCYLWGKHRIPIEEDTVVGILASNCIEYCTLLYSLIRARAISLNLSTKNSLDGLVHLLNEGKASVLVVHPQFIEIAKSIGKAMPSLQIYFLTECELDDFPYIPNLSPKSNKSYTVSAEMESRGRGRPEDSDRIVMYMHTSGSTLFPKLIAQGCKQIMAGLRYGDAAQRGLIDSNSVACGFLPLFHVAGNVCEFLRIMFYGATFIVPPTPFVPTGPNIVQTLKKYQPTILLCVPWMLEQVYFTAQEDPTVYPLLRNLRMVMFGGASFPEQIATKLVEQNINLVSLYGMTETTGPALMADSDPNNKAWNLMIPVNSDKARFLSVEGYTEEKELVFQEDERSLAPGLTINPETKAFHTGDLFLETPAGSGKWAYKGRYDDILVHSDGEKTRPLPVEMQLMADGKGAFKNLAILGAGRSGTCLLVEPSSDTDRSDADQLIQSLIKNVNQQIPKHSRIRKNMIYILPPGRTLPCTAKGNISRKKILVEYEHEIDHLYLQATGKSEHEQLLDLNAHAIESFLQVTIAGILDLPKERFDDHSKSLVDMGMDSIAAMEFHGRIIARIPELNLSFASIFDNSTIDALSSHILSSLKDVVLEPKNVREFLQSSIARILDVSSQHFDNFDDSLIDLGMDSIAAMEFRNVISKRFTFLDLPFSFVFEYPTINSLSEFLIHTAGLNEYQNGTEEDSEDLDEYFERFVNKYTIKKIVLPQKQIPNGSDDMQILMTGASGYLGVHVINELLLNTRISHIYCLVRGNNPKSCKQKLEDAFDNFHLDKVTLLAEDSRLTVFPCDLGDEHFGLDEATYEYLQQNVTHIYHGAWRMDFNSNLEAFEPTCLVPTLNLAKFALSGMGPKQYIFISSIGACSADKRPRIPEAPHPCDIRIAMPNGYSRSKLVAEEALVRMGKQGLPVTIIRYGQISGNSVSGAWNTREQFPILIRNAVTTGVSPIVTLPTDWIPVDIGAKSLTELITYPKQSQELVSVYHQVNPHASEPWTDFIRYVSHCTGRRIQMLPLQDWWSNLLKLAETNERLKTEDPIFTLLPYLEKMASSSSESPDIRLDTKISCERSPTLAKKCPIINESLIARYLAYWKQIGFLDDSEITSE